VATAEHVALIGAIEEMARAQRETGAWLARTLECGRGGVAVIRTLQHGPRQVGEIAQAMRVDVSVASRQVAALAEAGLVARDVAPGDRRARTVELTEAGRALAARSAHAAVELAAAVFGDWSDAEIDLAAEQFRKVAAAVLRHHAGTPAGPPAGPPTAAPRPAPPPAPPPTPLAPTSTPPAPLPPEREIA
jgi:DNA-binding MarR family transcriptional regulator